MPTIHTKVQNIKNVFLYPPRSAIAPIKGDKKATIRAVIVIALDHRAVPNISIGITNQRETTILWDKNTGKPVYNAIVWQDRRTQKICKNLKKRKLENFFRKRTGLFIDPYFSATKIKWIIENVAKSKKLLKKNNLMFGSEEQKTRHSKSKVNKTNGKPSIPNLKSIKP